MTQKQHGQRNQAGIMGISPYICTHARMHPPTHTHTHTHTQPPNSISQCDRNHGNFFTHAHKCKQPNVVHNVTIYTTGVDKYSRPHKQHSSVHEFCHQTDKKWASAQHYTTSGLFETLQQHSWEVNQTAALDHQADVAKPSSHVGQPHIRQYS
jgi:hypothetical protein